ncbi:Protein dispatched-like protein 1 [Frankliniella fusca]|uniref:Protein dispatched-like protein 1 n=1 Tax=Frankliniella fusca TaxID=407009 RepID=A0AAE1LM76_9NEOP|nr:Protein dispatched-like protein 1 [Frankliniella fusca]
MGAPRHGAVLLAVLLAGLCLAAEARVWSLQGLQGTAEGDACTCSSRTEGLELLRGQGALADCEAGFYCACGRRLVEKCFVFMGSPWHLDEAQQMCTSDADCASQLTSGSTVMPGPTAPPTSAPPPAASCDCGRSDGPPQQLIRGKDEQGQCEAGAYCDCASHAVQHCEGLMRFNEDSRQCELYVDCEAAFTASTPATTPSAAERCACAAPSPAQQLIRGADELARCEHGDFCDCARGLVQRCPLGPFDEAAQACSLPTAFDCRAHLDPSSGTAPTAGTEAAPTANPAPECRCDDARGQRQQLVRGADQLQRCEAGDYCDCASQALRHCGVPGLVFDEGDQACTYAGDGFCAAFFDPESRTTRVPAPVSSSTTVAASTTSAVGRACVCQRGGPGLQLVRGAGEEASCSAGYYCDCQARALRQCFPTLGVRWMFDEDQQACEYDFDCRAYMDAHPVPSGGGGGGAGGAAANAAPGLADKPMFWYRFIAVAMIATLVSLGLIYSIQIYYRGDSTPPGRLPCAPKACRKATVSEKPALARESAA